MSSLHVILAWFYFSFGLFLLIFSLLTLKNKIPMNHYAGFRFPQSFHSEENWYKINSYGGRVTLPFSIILMVIGLITPFVKFQNNRMVYEGILLSPLIMILFPTLLSYNYARKLP